MGCEADARARGADCSSARRIASAGRAILRDGLTMETVWAYWEAVLRRYAAVQRFAPQQRADAVSFADSLLDDTSTVARRVRCNITGAANVVSTNCAGAASCTRPEADTMPAAAAGAPSDAEEAYE